MRAWPLVTALAVLGCAAMLSPSPRVADEATAPDTLDMEGFQGESGLWVRETGGQLQVAWLTAPDETGLLEVWRGGEQVHRATTPPGRRHVASLSAPIYPVVLRFGSA